jgi:hypothetical protein
MTCDVLGHERCIRQLQKRFSISVLDYVSHVRYLQALTEF